MGQVNITYEEALQGYPDQVKEVEASIRKGRSKSKNDALESFEWSIYYAERIQAVSLGDILSGAQPPSEPSIEEKLAKLKDTVSATLQATKGRGRWQSEVIPELPHQIYEQRKAFLEEQAAERARFEAMSTEEKEKEREELLNQLRGPGFMELRILR